MTDEAVIIWTDSMSMWDDPNQSSRKADTMKCICVACFQSGDFANAQRIFEDAIMRYMLSEDEDGQHLDLIKSKF